MGLGLRLGGAQRYSVEEDVRYPAFFVIAIFRHQPCVQ